MAVSPGNFYIADMSVPTPSVPLPGETWDAIVIGSGIGGLAAAALLSLQAQQRVLVLERHSVAGGFTHVFGRRNYEWDVGLHYVGEVQQPDTVIRQLFDRITEGRLQWAPLPNVYDRVFVGDRVYDFVSGTEPFRAKLNEYFPQNTRAIDQYLAAVQSARKASKAYFAEKAIPRPLAWLFGPLLRRGFLRWTDCTTAEVLDRLTTNRELKGLLAAQWGNYGLPPAQSSFGIHAMIVSHYLEGASYPIGGAGRIVEAIQPVIERHGGRIMVKADVTEIMVERQRAVGVRLRDGREFRAARIISDAGLRNTVGRLLSPTGTGSGGVPPGWQAIPPSSGHLCLYVGVTKTAADLGLVGTNLWIHPDFNYEANLARSAADVEAPLPFLYVSFPSAKDPDFGRRHPGRATVEVIAPAPYGWFAPWQDTSWHRRGEAYEALKQRLTQRLQAGLVQQVPVLAGHIDYAELSTPLSTRHFTNHAAGETYGLSSTPARFRLRDLVPRSPIRGLYFTGQDVSTLGIAGALVGGALTASFILRRNLL